LRSHREELAEFIRGQIVINTHCHHLEGREFVGFDLDRLIEKSYVSWAQVPVGKSAGERASFLEKVRSKSYFVWLEKSLRELYGFDEPVTPGNWERHSGCLTSAHRDENHHLSLLKERCGYGRIILDCYWNPGSDHGHPELFAPNYRINMFLYGYDRDARDHNGNNPLVLYDRSVSDLDEYAALVREMVTRRKKEGCVALKSALAYDRSIRFDEVPKEKAREVFRRKPGGPTDSDIRNFQDWVFHEICAAAREEGLPFQCHTGLGALRETNALQLRNVIAKFPEVKFVLFHGGYPWIDDLLALVHNHPNVYADLCWLPIISPSAAARALHELVEVGTSDRVMWGCDTWTSEESYGALLAFRHVLARVLSEKVEDGYFSLDDAKAVAVRVARANAAELFGLEGGGR
jgi:predicted TIM-barrel fold metal-dependent hydrolase